MRVVEASPDFPDFRFSSGGDGRSTSRFRSNSDRNCPRLLDWPPPENPMSPRRALARSRFLAPFRRWPFIAIALAIGVGRGELRAQGMVDYPLPNSGLPYGIVSGPDGALWFGNVNRIQRITTNGTITSFAVGLVNGVHGITVG